MRRLYRIYYDSYSDEEHRRVLEELKRRFGVEVVDHRSSVLPEFRFVELMLQEPNREGEISSLISSILGGRKVKVDWIDATR